MSRELQHIAPLLDVQRAEREGLKVKTLCGRRIYPMTRMKDEIPTCTPCAIKIREELNALLARPATTHSGTFTWTSTATSGGAS